MEMEQSNNGPQTEFLSSGFQGKEGEQRGEAEIKVSQNEFEGDQEKKEEAKELAQDQSQEEQTQMFNSQATVNNNKDLPLEQKVEKLAQSAILVDEMVKQYNKMREEAQEINEQSDSEANFNLRRKFLKPTAPQVARGGGFKGVLGKTMGAKTNREDLLPKVK